MISVKTGPYEGKITNTALEFPYELDDFQTHGVESIEKDHHIIVTAHTGCGKTTLAEYAIGRHIKLNHRIIYTTPIKALSNQIHANLNKKYTDWDVGIKTGDIEINSNAQVVIMTTEILRNALFRGENELLEHVGCVIFDEVHWIKDRDRGHVWEESIISLPKHVQIIMLSATIPDAEKFAGWVAQTKKHQVDLIPTTHRVVPLTHYIMSSDGLHPIMDNTGKFNSDSVLTARSKFDFRTSKLNEYLTRLDSSDKLPAFFFCFSRDKCEQYANQISLNLVDGKTSREIENLFDSYITKFGDRYKTMYQTENVKKLLSRGVCYHHSGLMHILKEIIEIIFSLGLIKILFVTETFAAGVNMPARTVVFTGLQKYDGYLGDLRYLKPEEYGQMAGRAGRRGLDTKGTVIILPFHPAEKLNPDSLKEVMAGKLSDIQSQFKVDYSFILKVIDANKQRDDAVNLVEYAKKSLLNQQAAKYITGIEYELAQIREQITLVPEPTDSNLELIESYYKLVETPMRMSRNKISKQIRAIKNKVNKYTEKDKNNFWQEYENYKKLLHLKKQEKQTSDNLDYQQHYIESTIRNILMFLEHLGYIRRLNSADTEDYIYLHEDLTVKGLIASSISECDPILFTELIQIEGLNKLTNAQLLSLFAVFIEERSTERKTQINPTVHFVINDLEEIARNLESVAGKFDLESGHWVDLIHREYVDICFLWASGGNVRDIYNLSDQIYEGNLVRNLLKLRSIAEATVKACEINHDDILAKKLEDYEEIIVRSIVTPESLYIKLDH